MKTCRITGFILTPSGEPLNGAVVEFKMTRLDIDGAALILPEIVSANTGEDGSLDVPLWPNSRSHVGTFYRATVYVKKNNANAVYGSFNFTVPDDEEARLTDLAETAPPAPFDEGQQQVILAIEAKRETLQYRNQTEGLHELVVADKRQTGLDVIQTGKDVVQTGLDVIQTGKDVIQTGKDVIQTGEDVTTVADSARTVSENKAEVERLTEEVRTDSNTVTTTMVEFRVVKADLIQTVEQKEIEILQAIQDGALAAGNALNDKEVSIHSGIDIAETAVLQGIATASNSSLLAIENKETSVLREITAKENLVVDRIDALESSVHQDINSKKTQVLESITTSETTVLNNVEAKETEVQRGITLTETSVLDAIGEKELLVQRGLDNRETSALEALSTKETAALNSLASKETSSVSSVEEARTESLRLVGIEVSAAAESKRLADLDVVQTGKDVVQTGKDVIQTGKDVIQTGEDVIKTADDRSAVALDKTSVMVALEKIKNVLGVYVWNSNGSNVAKGIYLASAFVELPGIFDSLNISVPSGSGSVLVQLVINGKPVMLAYEVSAAAPINLSGLTIPVAIGDTVSFAVVAGEVNQVWAQITGLVK